MKLCLISDTHEMHEQVTIPECDVLVHAGDLTGRGSPARTQMALEWLDKQPAKHVICIAGNHDFFFQDYPQAARDLVANTRVIYLENSGVELEGLRFWGSPYTPKFFDWAFMYDRADGEKMWSEIPEGTDVLITHGPPSGILDRACPQMESAHLGCYDLRKSVQRVKPKIHVFGHIHGGSGKHEGIDTTFYNTSVVDEAYKVVHKPFLVEV